MSIMKPSPSCRRQQELLTKKWKCPKCAMTRRSKEDILVYICPCCMVEMEVE